MRQRCGGGVRKRIAVLLACGMGSLLLSSSAAAFIRDPWIQDVTQTSVTVTWEATSTGGTQMLAWGTAADSLTNSIGGELVSGNLYRATVTGLDVSTSWYYQVTSDTETSAVGTFVTAACSTEPFTFVAAGDNRDGVSSHQAVVDAIQLYGGAPDFEINTGDIVNGTDYLEFFDVEKVLLKDLPIFPSPGNHDNASEYQYGFDRPLYYAYDYGNARFIAWNSDGNYSPGSAQYDWLVTELADAAARKQAGEIDWVVAYHHHPAYSSGSHGNESGVDNDIVPLYEQYGVDLVINGHDHNYERSVVGGITYLVTGGGGVSLRGVTCDTGNGCIYAESVHHFTQVTVDGGVMTIRAIDTSGNVLDTSTLTVGPPASGEPCLPDDPKGPGDDPGNDPGGNPNGGVPGISVGGCSCALGAGSMPQGAAALLALLVLGSVMMRRRKTS